MKPELIHEFISPSVFDEINQTTGWLNLDLPRDEAFMSEDRLRYSYTADRFYDSTPFTPIVSDILGLLNVTTKSDYDVCFLNRYNSANDFLGWHADDSPEMDQDHPICTISLGSEREIWIKEIGTSGEVPPENRFKLPSGSCFIMPAGF